jgi:hypothetical protein
MFGEGASSEGPWHRSDPQVLRETQIAPRLNGAANRLEPAFASAPSAASAAAPDAWLGGFVAINPSKPSWACQGSRWRLS